MFVDDLILFAKADLINCSTIKDVLDKFCAVSNQTISEVKSKVYFSSNVDRDKWESLNDILGFASTLNLGKYLGIPIKHPTSSSQDFNFILDRVKQKLVGWKANLLALVGRAVLIQASSSAIPSYVMQCSNLPSHIMQGLDEYKFPLGINWNSEEDALGWMAQSHKTKERRRTGSANFQG